ncbi:hypothetical protein B9Y78_08205 [Stenotrophomonas maltophilia]|nr:hypothetical protein B9Y78_08205 [Stenotrophomonas maltophilia]
MYSSETLMSVLTVLTPSLTVQRLVALRMLFLETLAENDGLKSLAPGVGMLVDPERCDQVQV